MTNDKKAKPVVRDGKICYVIDWTERLSEDPHIKQFAMVPDTEVSEEKLSPTGKEILRRLRKCKVDKKILNISIGPMSVVVRFVVKNGNPMKSQAQVTDTINGALKNMTPPNVAPTDMSAEASSFFVITSGVTN